MAHTPKTSDSAVLKATGRSWNQWFAILDKERAGRMEHSGIARLLHSKYLSKKGTNVVNGGWWAQMVAVEYERARGLRAINQQKSGFYVSVSKSVPVSLPALQLRWKNLLRLKPVVALGLELVPSKTRRSTLRYRASEWSLLVYFDQPRSGVSRIIVEASRLPRQSLVEEQRAFWKALLSRLDEPAAASIHKGKSR